MHVWLSIFGNRRQLNNGQVNPASQPASQHSRLLYCAGIYIYITLARQMENCHMQQWAEPAHHPLHLSFHQTNLLRDRQRERSLFLLLLLLHRAKTKTHQTILTVLDRMHYAKYCRYHSVVLSSLKVCREISFQHSDNTTTTTNEQTNKCKNNSVACREIEKLDDVPRCNLL